MSLLLDTHDFYWWVVDSPRLTPVHRALFQPRQEPIYVSSVTGWEISIKVKIGKWPDAAPLLPNLTKLVLDSGLQPLDLTLAQSELAGSLDLVHRDPFDRLLAAQAIDLKIPLATVDTALSRLGCQIV